MTENQATGWTVAVLNETVADEIRSLPRDMRVSFDYITELIMSGGLEKVGMPHIRYLEGPLWEMRLRGRDGIARAIYVAVRHRRVVVVRVFIKQTQRTPRREIELALRRAREVLQ